MGQHGVFPNEPNLRDAFLRNEPNFRPRNGSCCTPEQPRYTLGRKETDRIKEYAVSVHG